MHPIDMYLKKTSAGLLSMTISNLLTIYLLQLFLIPTFPCLDPSRLRGSTCSDFSPLQKSCPARMCVQLIKTNLTFRLASRDAIPLIIQVAMAKFNGLVRPFIYRHTMVWVGQVTAKISFSTNTPFRCDAVAKYTYI